MSNVPQLVRRSVIIKYKHEVTCVSESWLLHLQTSPAYNNVEGRPCQASPHLGRPAPINNLKPKLLDFALLLVVFYPDNHFHACPIHKIVIQHHPSK